MKDQHTLDLEHRAGLSIETPGSYGVLWALTDTVTGEVIAEGTGNTEQDAQKRFRDNLIQLGWNESDIYALTQDEPDWNL